MLGQTYMGIDKRENNNNNNNIIYIRNFSSLILNIINRKSHLPSFVSFF